MGGLGVGGLGGVLMGWVGGWVGGCEGRTVTHSLKQRSTRRLYMLCFVGVGGGWVGGWGLEGWGGGPGTTQEEED